MPLYNRDDDLNNDGIISEEEDMIGRKKWTDSIPTSILNLLIWFIIGFIILFYKGEINAEFLKDNFEYILIMLSPGLVFMIIWYFLFKKMKYKNGSFLVGFIIAIIFTFAISIFLIEVKMDKEKVEDAKILKEYDTEVSKLYLKLIKGEISDFEYQRGIRKLQDKVLGK